MLQDLGNDCWNWWVVSSLKLKLSVNLLDDCPSNGEDLD